MACLELQRVHHFAREGYWLYMDHEKPGRFVATASSVGDLEVIQFDLQPYSEGVDVLSDGTAGGEVMRLIRHGNVLPAPLTRFHAVRWTLPRPARRCETNVNCGCAGGHKRLVMVLLKFGFCCVGVPARGV